MRSGHRKFTELAPYSTALRTGQPTWKLVGVSNYKVEGMIMKLSKFFILIGSMTALTTAQAVPINGGFESGDFSNWTLDIPMGVSDFPPFNRPAGTAGLVSSWRLGNMPADRQPEEGNYFLTVGTLDFGFFTGDTAYDISVNQTFSLNQGESLTGAVFYFNGDYEPQDSVWVKVFDGSGNNLLATPWQEFSGGLNPNDPNSVPYLSASPWTSWQWTAPATGDYTLKLGVSTFGDNNLATFGFFDAIGVTSAVPEPSSTALLAGLLAGFAIMRNRRNP